MAAPIRGRPILEPPSPPIARFDSHPSSQYAGKHPRLRPILPATVAQVHVGGSTTAQTFNVDRDTLASCSVDFRNAVQTDHKVSTHVYLPNEDPLIFEAFSTYITGESTGTLVRTESIRTAIDCSIYGRKGTEDWDEMFLVSLYAFAARYKIRELGKVVLQDIKWYYLRRNTLPSREVMDAVASAAPNRDDDLRLVLLVYFIIAHKTGRLDAPDLSTLMPSQSYQEMLEWECFLDEHAPHVDEEASDDDDVSEAEGRMIDWYVGLSFDLGEKTRARSASMWIERQETPTCHSFSINLCECSQTDRTSPATNA